MHRYWIDYLRLLAAFAVICRHVTGPAVELPAAVGMNAWWFANATTAFSRFCVPAFVMITGALLLGRESDPLAFYRARVGRLVPALLFWFLFYLVFSYYSNPVIATGGWKRWIASTIFNGRSHYHLWYLPMILTLMLFVPYLNMFLNGRKPTGRELALLLVVMAPLLLLAQVATALTHLTGKAFDWWALFVPFFAHLLLGYAIVRYREKIRIPSLLLMAGFLGGVLYIMAFNFVLISRGHVATDFVALPNASLGILMMTGSLFLLAARSEAWLPRSELVRRLGDCSFGIYLIHPVFIWLCSVLLAPRLGSGIAFMAAAIAFTAVASAATIVGLRRIPAFRRIS
ncbi:MAG: putative rane protein [Sphingomonas bacterium]|nr:putative rane protein [Sphingomonas bacterium]